MRVLFISDLHETGNGEQFNWLMSIIHTVRPDLLLSAGDWDVGMTEDRFKEILNTTPIITIFGNHENMSALENSYDERFNRRILLNDFQIVEFNGLKISGVNGIYSKKKNMKKGVPRQKGDSFIRKLNEFVRMNGGVIPRIDIFLCHEVPEIPEYKGKIRMFEGTKMMKEIINTVKPVFVLNGHLHISEYTFTRLPYGGFYLRIDSSLKHRAFALLDISNNSVMIRVFKGSLQTEIMRTVLKTV